MIMTPQNYGDVDAVEQIQLQESDFVPAPAEGTTISSGETREVFRSEVGEDGSLSSYTAVQLGGDTGANPKSARGKMFINLRDTNQNEVSDRVEFRFVARPLNENSRTPLTPFFTLRDLDNSDPEKRQALPPVTNGRGQAQVVQDGRVIALEVRTGTQSVEISLSDSVVELPAIGGY